MKNLTRLYILLLINFSCSHESLLQRDPSSKSGHFNCKSELNMGILSSKILDGTQKITNKIEADLLFFYKDNLNHKIWKKIQHRNLTKKVNRITKNLPQFKINKARVTSLNKQVNKTKLQETLFIIPANDGEALRSLQLMQKMKAPYLQVSNQGWGASLENEILNNQVMDKIKKVLVFELPHPETEKLLREKGIELVIIDHHSYQGIDRTHKLSAIEQLANYLEITLNKVDMQLAVNDRSYIPGLKKLALSYEEVMNIRRYDHISQGMSLNAFNKLIKKAEEVIPKLQEKHGIFIIDKDYGVPNSMIIQLLSIQSKDGLSDIFVLIPSEVGFNGNPKVVKALFDIDFEKGFSYKAGTFAKYSLGDPKVNMYFGFEPNTPPAHSKELISDEVLEYIKTHIMPLNDHY